MSLSGKARKAKSLETISAVEVIPKELKERSRLIDRMLSEERRTLLRNPAFKLLLLGAGDAGKSTIIKQMKILHMSGFSDDEIRDYRNIIQKNAVAFMRAVLLAAETQGAQILESTEAIEKGVEIEAAYQSVKAWDEKKSVFTEDISRSIYSIWNLPVFQHLCRDLGEKIHLNHFAEFWFSEMPRVGKPDFTPTQDDVLKVRLPTKGIHEIKFQVTKTVSFVMVDVGGQRSERKKWIHCFSEVTAVIFIAALSEFDQCLVEDESVNRLQESLNLFKEMLGRLSKIPFILFLNKTDIFEEKIKVTPLHVCFPKYKGSAGDAPSAANYILEKFMKKNSSYPSRPVYSHFTCATDTENIRKVFSDVKDVVLRQNLTLIV